jgi:SAM-dependent methyltransferase
LWELRNQSNWDVYGVEVDAESVDFARRKLGLDVYHGTVDEPHFPDDYFDVVTMWDVIEHLHDPFETLLEIRRILKPGGKLIISTPNAYSWDATLFGRYWIGLDFPRHLYVFSSITLGRLLKRANLLPERFFCFYGRYTTFALSLSMWFNAHVTAECRQKLWRDFVLLPIFRYITLPYFWIVDKLKRGAIISVVAKKVNLC